MVHFYKLYNDVKVSANFYQKPVKEVFKKCVAIKWVHYPKVNGPGPSKFGPCRPLGAGLARLGLLFKLVLTIYFERIHPVIPELSTKENMDSEQILNVPQD